MAGSKSKKRRRRAEPKGKGVTGLLDPLADTKRRNAKAASLGSKDPAARAWRNRLDVHPIIERDLKAKTST